MSQSRIVIMVAAGSGTRMGSPQPKQFLPLAGKTVLAHSIDLFQQTMPDALLLMPVATDQFTRAGEIVAESKFPERIKLIAGGHNRYTSVANGIAQIDDPEAIVFVHDGVRCLVTAELLLRCEKAAIEEGSAIPCIPVQDSLREKAGGRYSSVDRNHFFMIQTPQTFRAAWLQNAFRQPYEEGFTDEATVVEKAGYRLHFVPGDGENIKLTRPVDLRLAEAIIAARANNR